MSDISRVGSDPKFSLPPDSTKGPPPNQTESLRKAQAAQQMAEAAKKGEELMQGTGKAIPSQEFMGVLENIVQEGWNVPDPSQAEATNPEGLLQGGDFRRDLQTIREFIRGANYLLGQGFDLPQALNKIKVEQGGAFWQNLQQILQRMGLEKGGVDLLKNLGGALLAKEGEEKEEITRAAAARAILELLRAESNPQIQKEQFLFSLQILLKADLKESSDRLLSYLRKRGGFSDQELAYYFQESRREIFQGPFLGYRVKRGSFWYLLFGLGAFGISYGFGLNFAASIAAGIAISTLLWVTSSVWGRK